MEGSKKWYVNDELHREDGPAIEYASSPLLVYLAGLFDVWCGAKPATIHLVRLDRLAREIEPLRALTPAEVRVYLLTADETGVSPLGCLIEGNRAARPQGVSAVDRLFAIDDAGTFSETSCWRPEQIDILIIA